MVKRLRIAALTASGHRRAMRRALLDAGYRFLYRWAFAAMRLWWFLTRPDHQGAMVAVWHDGRVLILRCSYRRARCFPGGGLRRGEAPRAGACRELAEEVGLVVAPEALTPAHAMTLQWDWRRDHVEIFELRLATPPVLALDGREIVDAAFMTPAAALAAEISPFARAYLTGRRMA
jgi:8-oxo-dGTP diphosphatase